LQITQVRLEAARQVKNIFVFTANGAAKDLVVYEIAAMQTLIDLCSDEANISVRAGACKFLGEGISIFNFSPQWMDLRSLEATACDNCQEYLMREWVSGSSGNSSAGGDVLTGGKVEGINVGNGGEMWEVESLSVISHYARLARRAIDVLVDILNSTSKVMVRALPSNTIIIMNMT
jgi:hypothetical protein